MINRAYFVMVATDENQKPIQVPGLIIEGGTAQMEWEAAIKRQELRKQRQREGLWEVLYPHSYLTKRRIMITYENIHHEFEPVFDENSRVLILGTFPSVKSREQNFYYGHPQNRFWKVLAGLTEEPVPETIEQKKSLLLRNRIAVWDVIASCDITGSSDSSIKNVVPVDLSRILNQSDIQQIFANGGTAKKLYEKYQKPMTGREIIGLPSTSPANAAFHLERLMGEWSVIKNLLDMEYSSLV